MLDLGTGGSGGLASGSGILGGLHVAMLGEADAFSSPAASGVRTSGGLIGSSTATAAASAKLGGKLQLAGTSTDSQANAAAADLSGVVHVVALKGETDGQANATASTVNKWKMTGAAAGTASASADLQIKPGLRGQSDGQANTAANMNTMLRATSSGAAAASGTTVNRPHLVATSSGAAIAGTRGSTSRTR